MPEVATDQREPAFVSTFNKSTSTVQLGLLHNSKSN
jgi:hypothetical protein